MAKGQCKATILQGGVTLNDVLVGATTHRCNKDAGHESSKESAEAIHDASGVTWYDKDPAMDQFDSED
jgi:hypothetical protein